MKGRVGHSKPWETGKFGFKDNYPDLSKHNNVMGICLTPEVSVTMFLLFYDPTLGCCNSRLEPHHRNGKVCQ